jgi:hypothetical protein
MQALFLWLRCSEVVVMAVEACMMLAHIVDHRAQSNFFLRSPEH